MLNNAITKALTYVVIGYVSWYGYQFQGKLTANGERFDMFKVSAAHKHLPFGTRVKITNLINDKSIVVVINDRGPYISGRHIDLSYMAAAHLDMVEDGVAKVKIQVLRNENF